MLGVQQAYKGKTQEYKLFWPEAPEFVRMAARFGATIVPFAAVWMPSAICVMHTVTVMLLLPTKANNVLHFSSTHLRNDLQLWTCVKKCMLCCQVGCDDSFNMILDGNDVVNLPFVGGRIANRVKQIPSARQGAAAKNGTTDLFIQPVSIPKSINRCTPTSL